ncbi:MAG: glycosyltransferase family 2 protein [Actinomycetota bacterium]|nr:glycosyltransferase family 2 protein [Actinomycetota bacterium]
MSVRHSIPEYSIVVPIYNEAETLPELLSRLEELMDKLDGPAEIVLVDDRSTDESFPLMLERSQRDPRFKVVRFARNFGHQLAITAGLDVAAGRAVVIMDGDLQDPPEVVLELARRWREGYEVVYAVRQMRLGDSFFKRITASLFYRVLRRLSGTDMPPNLGDFRLVDRKAVDAFKQMRESNRYVRGMFAWVGFEQIGVPFTRAERFAGTTKYPLRKMINFALDGVVGFSEAPLRLALNLGFLLSTFSFLGGIAAALVKVFGVYAVPGWASLVVITFFLAGVQLIILGMIGEYVAHIHREVKQRPLYVVDRKIGFDGSVDDFETRYDTEHP